MVFWAGFFPWILQQAKDKPVKQFSVFFSKNPQKGSNLSKVSKKKKKCFMFFSN